MEKSRTQWYLRHPLWLEIFVLVNLAFLAPDIYLAHSTNLFRHAAEYLPFIFSVVAPILLLAGLVAGRGQPEGRACKWLGFLVGWVSVVVGIAGLVLHLESGFFREETLDSLVYTAPFAAPLAYTGIGLLLLMNRMVNADSADWPRWVLLLAMGGFMGNFIFSLADHAQNGFFHPSEWVPVASSAFAIGFLLVPFLVTVNRAFLILCAGVMIGQVVVGLLGFYYHTTANLRGPSPSMFDNFVYGAPSMAPLLFPNLVLLTLLGLWILHRHLPPKSRERASAIHPSPAEWRDS
ncbi:MAG TPA: hypothetical protein VH592_03995 [Gemmataceae bacterium]|jgi:hypothetical protein